MLLDIFDLERKMSSVRDWQAKRIDRTDLSVFLWLTVSRRSTACLLKWHATRSQHTVPAASRSDRFCLTVRAEVRFTSADALLRAQRRSRLQCEVSRSLGGGDW